MSASTSSSASSGGMSALGVLGIIFVMLKLFGLTAVAEWSWWWVTAPFWAGLAFVIAFFVGAALIAGVVLLVAFIADWWATRARRSRNVKAR